jgi:hypothetical protein
MVKKRKAQPGNTIPGAARKLGLPEGQFRRAVDRGEVKVVEFAGLKRITDAEIARIANLFGISELDEAAPEVAQPTKATGRSKTKPAKNAQREEANA